MTEKLRLLCTRLLSNKEIRREKREGFWGGLKRRAKKEIFIEMHCGVCKGVIFSDKIYRKELKQSPASFLSNPQSRFKSQDNVTGSYDFVMCGSCYNKLKAKKGKPAAARKHLNQFLNVFEMTRNEGRWNHGVEKTRD